MSAPTQPRTVAGRYRFVREVGRGGMGSVWLAVDERLGREVAVKGVGRLPGHSVTDQARALREVRSSAALNHPNVVSVYDAVAEGDHVWLVMEYVEGRTLGELMRAEGPLEPTRVAAIGAQVADGLAAAHARGTVHRDVKPGNVLVAEDGTAKISDFGIARTLGEETLTESGLLTGTPSYFSPELARGQDPSPASDVWALGATLYAATEGRPPYPDQPNALALLATIADRRPPAPERAGPLTEPVGRMMDPDPGSRWSMADAAHALHRVAASDDDATRPETAAVVAPIPASATATDLPTQAGAPPRRSRRPALLAVLVVMLLAAAGALYLVSRDSVAPTAGSRSPSPAHQGSRSPSATVTETTTASPEPSAGAASGQGASSRIAFVEDYYAALPDDTQTGWSLLTPSYQDETGGYDDYEGFWSGVSSVEVEGARVVGPHAVDVQLVYDGSDRETRRIILDRTPDGWRIGDSWLV